MAAAHRANGARNALGAHKLSPEQVERLMTLMQTVWRTEADNRRWREGSAPMHKKPTGHEKDYVPYWDDGLGLTPELLRRRLEAHGQRVPRQHHNNFLAMVDGRRPWPRPLLHAAIAELGADVAWFLDTGGRPAWADDLINCVDRLLTVPRSDGDTSVALEKILRALDVLVSELATQLLVDERTLVASAPWWVKRINSVTQLARGGEVAGGTPAQVRPAKPSTTRTTRPTAQAAKKNSGGTAARPAARSRTASGAGRSRSQL